MSKITWREVTIAIGLVLLVLMISARYTVLAQKFLDECVLEGNTQTVCIYMARHRNLFELLFY